MYTYTCDCNCRHVSTDLPTKSTNQPTNQPNQTNPTKSTNQPNQTNPTKPTNKLYQQTKETNQNQSTSQTDQKKNQANQPWVITGFRREVAANCALMVYYTASSGNFVQLVATNCVLMAFLTTTRCVITQKSSVLNHPTKQHIHPFIHPSVRPSVLYQHRTTQSQSNINWPGTKGDPTQWQACRPTAWAILWPSKARY